MSVISLQEVRASERASLDRRSRERTHSLTFKFYEAEKERRETTQKILVVRSAAAAGAMMKCHLTPLIAQHTAQVRAGKLPSLHFRPSVSVVN